MKKFAVFLLIFGLVVSIYPAVTYLTAIGILLYAVPLLTQYLPSMRSRIYGTWFGVFLLLQSVYPVVMGNLSATYKLDRRYLQLAPNIHEKMIVRTGHHYLDGIKFYNTDSRGFRTTHAVDYRKKEPGVFRIFTIGASTTICTEVDDRETWSAVLENKLREKYGVKVEVINAGISGTRARHNLATVESILAAKPDLVILLLGINDWDRQVKDALGDKENNLGRRIQRQTFYLHFKNSLLGKLFWREPTTAVLDNLTRRGPSLARARQKTFYPKGVSRDFSESVKKILRVCKKNHVKCLLLSQPTVYQEKMPDDVQKSLWMTPPDEDYTITTSSLLALTHLYNEALRKESIAAGVAYFDLDSSIPKTHAYFMDDCHFTVLANRHIGEVLAEPVITLLRL